MAMDLNEIEKLIKEAMPDAKIEIQDLAGDGNHYSATVTSSTFAGKSKIEQHKMVYNSLKGKKGFKLIKPKVLTSKFHYYFGEDQGRYIIEIEPNNLSKVQKILKENSVHYDEIGIVTKNEVILDKEPILHIDDLTKSNKTWLIDYMSK